MKNKILAALLAMGCGVLCAIPAEAGPGQFGLEPEQRWWAESGFGGSRVHTRGAGLPGTRGAAVLSIGLGVRATPHLGAGIEYASSASFNRCARWDCGGQTWNFKPSFNRASLFGELRMFDGRLRMRYGVGDNFFCYAGGPGVNLWYLALVSLLDADDVVQSECASHHGPVRTASIGYHWNWWEEAGPITAGLRLGVERGSFRARQSIGMPAFRYRAVTLTLQVSFN